MVEQADAGKAHDHIMGIAGLDDIVVADGTAGLGDILDAAAESPLDVVPEGEECIGSQCHVLIAGEPGLLLFHSEDLGLNCEKGFPLAVVQDIHILLANVEVDGIVAVRAADTFFEGEVHVLSAIVRMGGGEARVDNVTSGGMQCGLQMDGQCHSLACTKKRNWVDRSPDGTVFAGTKIPAFDKILQIVIKEHIRFPHFRLIGWDFSVDREGEPVFIEYNVCPGANQMTCGPTFGDLTDRVLEDVLVKKTMAHAHN